MELVGQNKRKSKFCEYIYTHVHNQSVSMAFRKEPEFLIFFNKLSNFDNKL